MYIWIYAITQIICSLQKKNIFQTRKKTNNVLFNGKLMAAIWIYIYTTKLVVFGI